jgi:hypothetical protein
VARLLGTCLPALACHATQQLRVAVHASAQAHAATRRAPSTHHTRSAACIFAPAARREVRGVQDTTATYLGLTYAARGVWAWERTSVRNVRTPTPTLSPARLCVCVCVRACARVRARTRTRDCRLQPRPPQCPHTLARDAAPDTAACGVRHPEHDVFLRAQLAPVPWPGTVGTVCGPAAPAERGRE